MKAIYKHRNCPRLQHAIKVTIAQVHKRGRRWWKTSPEDIGTIYEIAYKADKSDVLNRLLTTFLQNLRSFIRADIRWEKPTRLHALTLIFILILFIKF